MSEERGLVMTNSLQPRPGPQSPAPQSFVLIQGPSNQMLVDAPCDERQLGAAERSAVTDPPSNLGIHLLSELGSRQDYRHNSPIPPLVWPNLRVRGTEADLEARPRVLLLEDKKPTSAPSPGPTSSNPLRSSSSQAVACVSMTSCT